MKILALGDPHGKLPENLDSIIKKNNIEVIVCIGEVFSVFREKDLSGYSNKKIGEKLIKKLNSYHIPTILLKGNMYMDRKGSKYFNGLIKKNKNIYHKNTGVIKLKSKEFVVFDMIYEKHFLPNKFVEKYMKTNKSRGKKLNEFLQKNKDSIIVSHVPPHGYVDKINWPGIPKNIKGKHVGSKILLNAIKKYKPKLVLCGHIHEAKGKAKIGKTIVYNLGCCGDYKILKV